ncbi:hypothetical protein [Kribbella sp. CA-294648]|uniref:hypothetical protein n=1 Tax=Kribbella sp. CA-294648 TaxID=3239948 RepID=UPI003D8F62DA
MPAGQLARVDVDLVADPDPCQQFPRDRLDIATLAALRRDAASTTRLNQNSSWTISDRAERPDVARGNYLRERVLGNPSAAITMPSAKPRTVPYKDDGHPGPAPGVPAADHGEIGIRWRRVLRWVGGGGCRGQ